MHALAINLVQAADAEDAWLQAEWGQSLLAEGDRRMQEAVTHLHVCTSPPCMYHVAMYPSRREPV